MSKPPRSFAPADLADARYRYEETNETVASIARRLGIGERTLHSNIVFWGWHQRRQPRPNVTPRARKAEERAPEPVAPPAVVVPTLTPEAEKVAEDIQSTVQREVAAIGMIVARLGPSTNSAQAERASRVLATLTRTLQEVLRLRSPQTPIEPSAEPTHDRGPDDPDEFLIDLARRMDAFAAARAGTRLPDSGGSGTD
jgi:hypothetical protein